MSADPCSATSPSSATIVLVVTDDLARRAQVCQAVGARLPQAQVVWASSTLDAIRRSFGGPLQLVVVDWPIDGAGGQALVRHLQRWYSDAAVLAFDDLAQDEDGRSVAPWHRLDAALDRWVLRHQAACPAIGSVVPS
jgi:CheY-like chemotaxis protein